LRREGPDDVAPLLRFVGDELPKSAGESASTSPPRLASRALILGRVLEARFQWSHARDLKPEPDDLVKIEAKLKSGLPDDTAPEAEHKKPGGG
jgi:hypothetical protein